MRGTIFTALSAATGLTALILMYVSYVTWNTILQFTELPAASDQDDNFVIMWVGRFMLYPYCMGLIVAAIAVVMALFYR